MSDMPSRMVLSLWISVQKYFSLCLGRWYSMPNDWRFLFQKEKVCLHSFNYCDNIISTTYSFSRQFHLSWRWSFLVLWANRLESILSMYIETIHMYVQELKLLHFLANNSSKNTLRNNSGFFILSLDSNIRHGSSCSFHDP